jgi:hypothetical protein
MTSPPQARSPIGRLLNVVGRDRPPARESIFRDEYVEVFHKPAESRFLLATFNNLRMVSKDGGFWGERFADRTGTSALGFVNATGNWFPERNMAAAIAACRPILEQYDAVVTYGSSMGAYAALKYSRRLGAHTAVAFSPQYSIDPEVVGSFDHRYLKQFRPELNRGAEIAADEVIENSFLFYDPLYDIDRKHAALIMGAVGCGNLVRMPTIGHEVISLFAKTPLARELLEHCMQGDLAKVTALAAQARKASPLRLFYIIRTMAERRPDVAQDMLNRVSERFEPDIRIQLESAVADGFTKRSMIRGSI